MKIDAVLHGTDLRGVALEARAAESLGHEGGRVTITGDRSGTDSRSSEG